MNYATILNSAENSSRRCRALWVAMLLAAMAMQAAAPHSSSAQELSNRGTEFLLTYLRNTIDGPPIVELHLTGANTDVTIHYPANAPTFSETVTITDNDITVVSLPAGVSSAWSMNAIGDNVVRAFAEVDFVAYMVNIRQFTSDAAMALPVETMNVEYFTTHYRSTLVSGDRSEFAVVAAFDNTEVQITPTRNMGAVPAGNTHTVTLNRGEAFYGQSNSNGDAGDLTGTRIVANRPVGVTNGNWCTNVPPNTAACDHIFQVAHPIQTWGDFIPVVNLPNRPSGTVYRVLAVEDNTEVQLDGAVVATLDRGQYFEPSPLTGAHIFEGDKPIFVTQFMTGVLHPGATLGDPAMGSMIPAEQYLDSYVFSTVGGALFSQNWLTVIAHNDDVGTSMMLDGALMPAGDFSPIAGTDYSWSQQRLDEGTHMTSSIRPHGITVAGYNPANSYLYPGGARFEFIAPGEDTDPPICTFEIVNNEAHGTVRDDRPEDSGVFFVRLSAGTGENVELHVDPFTPGDPVVTYRLTLVDPTQNGRATVVGIDGSGNRCESEIEILVDDEPPIDQTPPECRIVSINRENGVAVSISVEVEDPGSGVRSVEVLTSNNAQLEIPVGSGDFYIAGETAEFDPPADGVVEILAEKLDLTAKATVVIRVMDGAGNTTVCDPVIATLSSEVPEAFDLGPNYPNPFNPSTSINFQVLEASFVSLKVYDVAGREIMTLVNETMEPGTYVVQWDGTDYRGEIVAGGVYMYRMQAGTYSSTRTMVLLK